jgi:NAD(P)-dependent dehydrogenase (short-subunit alcohol dehydrogenase family)
VELERAAAVVTGGARGIGKAIALTYASRGARVVLADVLGDELAKAASEIEAAGGEALPVRADVTDPADVEVMARQVESRLGGVDILVNCAGTQSGIGPLWEVDPGKWLNDLLVSLYGAFLSSRAFVPGMIEAGCGYVINVVGAGAESAFTYTSGYCSAKAGLVSFTEGLAAEVRDHGVKVFAMFPGAVRTELTRNLFESPEGKRWLPDLPGMFSDWEVPVDRAAALALDLVSGRADALTGRYFSVVDDFEEILSQAEEVVSEDRLVLRMRRLARRERPL